MIIVYDVYDLCYGYDYQCYVMIVICYFYFIISILLLSLFLSIMIVTIFFSKGYRVPFLGGVLFKLFVTLRFCLMVSFGVFSQDLVVTEGLCALFVRIIFLVGMVVWPFTLLLGFGVFLCLLA